jgi:anthranilate phosphoribosyltransferase
MSLLPFLHRVTSGIDLSVDEAHEAMSVLLEGGASDSVIAGFLVALRIKGETASELAGFARAMRERSIPVETGPDVIDTCGTGGEEPSTFNISTVAAIVMAGAGARVAKHGNRSFSSRSGSADVLEALGIRISMTPEEAASAVRDIGIGFLFAPLLHPAMKYAQPVRRELKMRTVFNFLGPLTNPARASSQIIGAPWPDTAVIMAEALSEIGTGHSFVVHGHDGLDEVSTTGPTDVYEVWTGRVEKHVWTPADFCVPKVPRDSLRGGDPAYNAQIAQDILEGKPGPPRDIVLVNAAVGLVAGGLASSLKEGMTKAAQSIDSGEAMARLSLLQKHFPHA